jgi:uncharacterized damage-inducible protein DinB
MSEIQRIEDQLKRAFEGMAWHGPSLRELLADVTAEQAAAHPLAKVHSIWEIVLHVAAWEDAVRRRLEGEPVKPSDEEDWPPVTDTSEAAWKNTLAILEHNHRQLRKTISLLSDSRLGEVIAPESASMYVTLHGIVQHDLYHAGQIALLKKAA